MLRSTAKLSWSALVVVTIVAAFALSLARLLLPLLGEYRTDIEGWIGGVIGQPVQIGEIDARFRGLYPSLTMQNVIMLDAQGQERLAAFQELSVDLDLWRSLLHGRFEPGTFRVVGVELLVEADARGRVRVAGFGGGGGERGREELRRWVMDRPRLAVEGATVIWRKATSASPALTFKDARIVLTNTGERHQLVAEVTLPADLGSALRINLDVTGDPSQESGWHGEGYLNVADAQLDRWWQSPAESAVSVQQGTATLEAWVEWRNGQIFNLAGEMAARELRLAAPQPGEAQPLVLNSLSASANWQRGAQGWRLLVSPLRWQAPGAPAIETELGVEQRLTGGDSPQLHVALRHARLQDLLPLASLSGRMPAAARQWIDELRPSAELDDIYLRVEGLADKPRFFVHGLARDLAWRPVRKIPGAQNLQLTFDADNDSAVVQFSGRKVRLDFATLFRQPIGLDTLEGTLVARRGDQGWTLNTTDVAFANPDAQGAARFGLELPAAAGAPVLDLTARIANGRGESLSRYLPAAVMSSKAVAWLDRSLKSGTVTQGALVLRGPLDHYPFADGEGRFQAKLQVVDGVLDFAPDWPVISAINGEVAFHERGIDVRAVRGTTLGSELQSVSVAIPGPKAAHRDIIIKGTARGSLAAGLQYLRESPLQRDVGRHLAGARAAGEQRTELTLRIARGAQAKGVAVDGAVNFLGNSLRLTTDGADLSSIRGRLNFTNTTVAAAGLEAAIFGQSVTLDVRGEPKETGTGLGAILIDARGRARPQELEERLGLNVLGLLEGEVDWQGKLRIDTAPGAGARLDLTSDLLGAALHLPLGLGKESQEARALRLGFALPLAAGSVIEGSLGEDLNGVFELARRNGVFQLARGELRFGGVQARMPSGPGLRIAGFLPHVDGGKWQLPPGVAGTGAGQDSAGLFSGIDVSIGEARLLGRDFARVIVQGASREGGWALNLTSEKIAGAIWIPRERGAPIRADFDRLVLDALPATAAKVADPGDPRRFPPTVLTVKQFSYSDWARGSLEATLLGTPQGLRLASGKLENGPTRLIGTGDWSYVDDRHETALDLVLETDNAGMTLADFGYAEALRGGAGFHTAYVTWPGAPVDYDLQRLTGTATVNIRKGRILEVEPGAGRIFGLLSFQALPRRLNLDFTDFFTEGFSFDEIAGDFVIRAGVATTDSLKVQGPAATIRVNGEVDLAQRTYNENVTVLPNVTGAVPWAAVGVGVTNPAAGAAVWLAERLLRKPVSDLTQVNYRVTGSWNNPTVEKLARTDGQGDPGSEGDITP